MCVSVCVCACVCASLYVSMSGILSDLSAVQLNERVPQGQKRSSPLKVLRIGLIF